MTAAIHTPSSSPSSPDFAFRSYRQNNPDASFSYSLSPSRQASATPPRRQPVLMLTPSPLRRRLDCEDDFDAAMQLDFDDFSAATGFSTPFHPSKRTSSQRMQSKALKPLPHFQRSFIPPLDDDDDDEGLFLRSTVGHTSLPLRTPERHTFDPIHIPNSVSNFNFSHAPKRKINHMSSSPKHGLTPLRIHQSIDENGTKRLATLAPLQAPRFLCNRGEAGSNVGRQADTLKQMRISDRSFDFETDSSSEEEFSRINARRNVNRPARSSGGVQEVVSSVSPDGHITKRRTRSRPVSLELMVSSAPNTSPKPPIRGHPRAGHRRKGSKTSVSEAGSPIRVNKAENEKPEFDRMASSATLFFGPAIINPSSNISKGESSTGRAGLDQSSHGLPAATRVKPVGDGNDDDLFSPTSRDSSFTSTFPKLNEASLSFAFSVTAGSPSPRGRIPTKFKRPRDSGVALSDDEADDLLQPVLTHSTTARPGPLRRFCARTSTDPQPSISFSTSSEATLFDDSIVTPSHESSRESAWPDSLLDVSLVDEFIVKTLEAGTKDGRAEKRVPDTPQKRTKTAFLGLPVHRPWASAVANKMVRMPLFNEKLPGPDFSNVMDSGGSAGDLSVPRKGLGSSSKPRKSCPGDLKFPSIFASSINRAKSNSSSASEVDVSPSRTQFVQPRRRLYEDVGLGRPNAKLTASQSLMRRSSSGAFSTASDASDISGLGTPTRKNDDDFRVPMLPLRSQYTPSNNTLQLTPLTANPLPIFNELSGRLHSVCSQLPISEKRTKENRRPNSSFSVSSHAGISEKAPSSRFATQPSNTKARKHQQQGDPHSVLLNHHLVPPRPHEQPGRFEREFVEVDKIGAGEFGSAIKVHAKHGDGSEDRVYAVKKSKRFEGNRHRSRLREEVEVLQHLSASAGPGFHPNVLGYVDSWEQDDQLYILTELCEYGNFAHFLNEYGHQFARLEEARVWKIFADISSGLRFMHLANVVHFDLKPANIFITAAGRFKIGDFGMASVWPRPPAVGNGSNIDASSIGRNNGFEREGDKMYLAAEVLQGRYGKETDIFSFGMMMLETATNIVVPTQGELWHKLREEDFSPVDGLEECSGALLQLITSMMRKDPAARPNAEGVYAHAVVSRARVRMEQALDELRAQGETRPEVLFKASPLAGVDASFLTDILGGEAGADTMAMDWSA